MSNTAKLYGHPVNGYVLVTSKGNYHITDDFVKGTALDGTGLPEMPFDTNLQAKIENAKVNTLQMKSVDFIAGLELLCLEKMEDFD